MSITRIQCFQHVSFEGPAFIRDWATDNHLEITKMFNQDPLPDPSDYDLLIILGGPMSVNDSKEYPWLEEEIEHIRKAISMKKSILGICLGAQLIAKAIGARVYPNKEKEIGWFPIRLTDEGIDSGLLGINPIVPVFHWHGETFDLPEGAIRLASSAACINQAFRYQDHVVALQFHLEASFDSIESMIQHGIDELIPSNYVDTADQIRAKESIHSTNRLLTGLLRNLI